MLANLDSHCAINVIEKVRRRLLGVSVYLGVLIQQRKPVCVAKTILWEDGVEKRVGGCKIGR